MFQPLRNTFCWYTWTCYTGAEDPSRIENNTWTYSQTFPLYVSQHGITIAQSAGRLADNAKRDSWKLEICFPNISIQVEFNWYQTSVCWNISILHYRGRNHPKSRVQVHPLVSSTTLPSPVPGDLFPRLSSDLRRGKPDQKMYMRKGRTVVVLGVAAACVLLATAVVLDRTPASSPVALELITDMDAPDAQDLAFLVTWWRSPDWDILLLCSWIWSLDFQVQHITVVWSFIMGLSWVNMIGMQAQVHAKAAHLDQLTQKRTPRSGMVQQNQKLHSEVIHAYPHVRACVCSPSVFMLVYLCVCVCVSFRFCVFVPVLPKGQNEQVSVCPGNHADTHIGLATGAGARKWGAIFEQGDEEHDSLRRSLC